MSLQELVPSVLGQYGFTADATYTLLTDQWNTTYHITLSNGQQYNLRICGQAFQNDKLLEDELNFVDFVARSKKVRVPTPVRNKQGTFVTFLDTGAHTRLCCLFEWIKGTPARGQLTIPLIYEMGKMTAHLHGVIQTFQFPEANDTFRPGYNFDEVLVASHREWITAYAGDIGADHVTLLDKAVDYAFAHLSALPKTRTTYGFIHADLHPGNFIVTEDIVAIIDFDQLGRGHFCFDFAVMMVELFDEGENCAALWSGFKDGYQAVAPLPFEDDEDDSALNPFVIAVHLGFLDWIYNTPSPQVREQWMPKLPVTYQSIQSRTDMHG
ncbi:MAG: phosphotransferase [Chloroflexota bacterium]